MTTPQPPVVLVTGCSTGGIGASLAKEFAAKGCLVYATSRRLEAMDGLTGSSIRKLTLDVTQDQAVTDVYDAVIKEQGRIDILVNNAGIPCVVPILDATVDKTHNAFDANVYSIIRTTRTIVPSMAARRSGLVINIGSITGIMTTPWTGIYAATKSAVRSITEAMWMECKPLGVNVMLVEPGGIRSNIGANGAPHYSMPSNSLYKAYADKILARIYLSQGPSSMDTDVFAKRVVAAALKKEPERYISIGNSSWLFYFLSWLPRSYSLMVLWKRIGALGKSVKGQ